MVNDIGPSNGGYPVKPVTGAESRPDKLKKTGDKNKAAFAQMLETAQQVERQQKELVISAHAQERMAHRDIELGEADMQELNKAVEKAEDKGARSSLLLYGDVALVANVPNRTIITAVDELESQEKIFTGIDSAVIVKQKQGPDLLE